MFWKQIRVQRKRATFSLSGTKLQGKPDLSCSDAILRGELTYFSVGMSKRDQTIALIPPMISSGGGTGPLDGQIPFNTYSGEVPGRLESSPGRRLTDVGVDDAEGGECHQHEACTTRRHWLSLVHVLFDRLVHTLLLIILAVPAHFYPIK